MKVFCTQCKYLKEVNGEDRCPFINEKIDIQNKVECDAFTQKKVKK